VSIIFWWRIVVTCSNLLIFFFFCYLRWPNSNWDGCLLNYRDQREVEQMSSHSIYICMLHRVSMPKVSSTLHFGQPISDTCNFWSFWSQVSWGSECAILCNFWCAPCCMLQRLILCVMMFAAFCCDHRHDSTTKRRYGLTRDLGFLNLTRMTVEWKSLSGPFFFLLCSVCLGAFTHKRLGIAQSCKHLKHV